MALVHEVIQFEGQHCDEVSIHFVDTPKICELHDTYFKDPSPTDCISFPINNSILGDVFVCPRTAQEYVAIHQGEVYEEVSLYVVHGLLHLMGYDDIEEADEKKMRAAESKHMQNIKLKGLILNC
jgi:probable rRNA maturation factor